ncbi:MAG: DUF4038 domain-containing protein [Armatimonadia bacterium]|nr:DUF4038 domain-containing protein [Armatimonadia bacterium]
MRANAALVCLTSLLSLPGGAGEPPEPVFTADEWQAAEPPAVGMDQAALDRVAEYVGGRGCVVRHGYMVHSWGDVSSRGDVASAAKPVYAHFIIHAAEEGLIPGFDAPVHEFEPRLRHLNPELDHKDREITWWDMAHQTSCYGVAERPGEAFNYNDYHMALLFDTLFLNVYGSSWERVDEEVLHPLLTDPIGCQDDPTFMAFGVGDRPGRLAISPRDFARFGLLYLRDGLWEDRRLVYRKHARMVREDTIPAEVAQSAGEEAEMIPGQRTIGSRTVPDNQCDHMGSYSWLWWTNGVDREGQRHWPDVPADAFGAFGHGGPRAMVVIPSLDLIISWNDAQIDSPEKENQALSLLVDAVQGDSVQALGPDPDNPAWLSGAGGEPVFICGPGDPEGFLYRGQLQEDGTRDGDQEALIEKLIASGANSLYIQAIRSHGGDGEPSHNPFIGHDPSLPLSDAVVDQWDEWLTSLDDAGVATLLFIYDDSTRVWDTGDEVGERERELIRSLVGRLRHHRNIIWCVAEEAEEALSPERIKRIAAEIKSVDPVHAVAVHLNHGLDFSTYADDQNIDQFAIQYNVETAEEMHEGMVRAWSEARGRYNLSMSECLAHGTGEHARRMSWAAAMAGAYVMVLEMDIATTDASDLRDCGVLRRFMESSGFAAMAPADDLALGDTLYVMASEGAGAIAYGIEPRLMGVGGWSGRPCDLRWLDCATGQTILQDAVEPRADGLWFVPAGLGPEVAVHARPSR